MASDVSSGAYPHLFSPLVVGTLELPNRCMMGSMHTGIERTGDWKRAAEFYAERVSGGVKLVVTGGIAPNTEGSVFPGAPGLFSADDVAGHRIVTGRIHGLGGNVAMQILHAGRYAYGKDCVAPSPVKSSISPHVPAELDAAGIEKQLSDIADTACRAREAGYDGVEIMGSEGYFINQFLVRRTNRRRDRWGGSYENRMRFPIEAVERVRAAVGKDFLIIYRISVIDLVPEGSSWDEVVLLASKVERAGADLLNSGIGWHESRVPTIATSVPRMAFAWITGKLKEAVSIPVVASNRVNNPDTAERILADGHADLVSMARPFLADAEFVNKARAGRQRTIAPCIACNQACLDHTFDDRIATCMVNPRACNETGFRIEPSTRRKSVAILGSGPAGLAAALTSSQRGYRVTMFERRDRIGGQLNMAAKIPGKEEFAGLVRWYRTMLDELGVTIHFGTSPAAGELSEFDAVAIATGVRPRKPGLPGEDGPNVLTYADLLANNRSVGEKVVILGGGGIGIDVAEFLARDDDDDPDELSAWMTEWGVCDPALHRGGLDPAGPAVKAPSRDITLLQRSPGPPGRNLGRTTRWIHRLSLRMKSVRMVGGVTYRRIDEYGVHITTADGTDELVPADTVVLCVGQEPEGAAARQCSGLRRPAAIIGGAMTSAGLDAKMAIDQGTRLAASW